MSKNTKKALLNDGDVMVAVPIFYTVYGAKTKAEQNLRQFHRIEAFTCVYCVIIVVREKEVICYKSVIKCLTVFIINPL